MTDAEKLELIKQMLKKIVHDEPFLLATLLHIEMIVNEK